MPELPEVETTKRGLMPLICEKKIIGVDVRQTALRRKVDVKRLEQICGHHFNTLERRAKYLLFHTSDPTHSLLIHLGMSGSLRVNSIEAPLRKHDHILINFDDSSSLRFHDPRRFGQFCSINPAYWPNYLARLGLEPLDRAFDGNYLYQCAAKRKIAVKSFIMDQNIVVGIGNIYATEALFTSCIHPASPAGSVPLRAYKLLADNIKVVLINAIAQGGTTLRDFVHSDGRGGYFKQSLAVYGRSGEPCPKCQQRLASAIISGRMSVFCPHCQKLY